MKPGTDSIHLERNINNRLDQLDSNGDIRATISAGVAENIKNQISNLQTNLIEGLVVVIIISLLLISWRAGLATAMSMITVLLTTVGILYAVGITLNTITLFALVLCLGLIVDDTTIMAEAIDAGRKAKLAKREIVSLAVKRVARASTAGTLVTMLAFAPMLFISGILGSFIRILPITIIVSLAVSLVISLTLIPFLSKWLLLSKFGKKDQENSPILKAEDWVSTKLANLVRIGSGSRKKAVAIGLVAIFLSFGFLFASTRYFSLLKFDIFPANKDTDQLGVALKFAPGTTIEQAEKATDKITAKLKQQLGGNLDKFTLTASGTATDALGRIQLISYKKRDVKSPELVTMLNKEFNTIDGVRVKFAQLDTGPPKDDLPFRVQVYSEDTAKSVALADDIQTYLKDRTITRASKTTAKVALTEVVGAQGTITRSDSKRILEVRAGFDADDTSALVAVAQKAVEDEFTADKLKSYGLSKDDVKFDFGNESNNQDSFKTMLIAFPILLVVMYLLLAIQFRSLLQPVLIFMAIPFSFFGVASGLYYTHNPLSFFVMIGFFALVGIAVNNTILLTDYANQARKDGNGHFESIALAVKARFRPLIATSLTSIVALVPLALSDPFWESLSLTLIFGLLSSTFLVIVVFPYYYLAAEYIRSRISRSKGILWLVSVIATIYVGVQINSKLILPILLVWNIALVLRRKYTRQVSTK